MCHKRSQKKKKKKERKQKKRRAETRIYIFWFLLQNSSHCILQPSPRYACLISLPCSKTFNGSPFPNEMLQCPGPSIQDALWSHSNLLFQPDSHSPALPVLPPCLHNPIYCVLCALLPLPLQVKTQLTGYLPNKMFSILPTTNPLFLLWIPTAHAGLSLCTDDFLSHSVDNLQSPARHLSCVLYY